MSKSSYNSWNESNLVIIKKEEVVQKSQLSLTFWTASFFLQFNKNKLNEILHIKIKSKRESGTKVCELELKL